MRVQLNTAPTTHYTYYPDSSGTHAMSLRATLFTRVTVTVAVIMSVLLPSALPHTAPTTHHTYCTLHLVHGQLRHTRHELARYALDARLEFIHGFGDVQRLFPPFLCLPAAAMSVAYK